MNDEMIWGYLKAPYEKYAGLAIPVLLRISSHPHAVITGASGTGKSQVLLFLIGKLLQANPDVIIYLCDFKNSKDFNFLQNYSYYFAGHSCYDGIMSYYEHFTESRETGTADKRCLLICDEYPAFINYLQMKDKINKTKKSNDVLSAVSEILMLGRGTGSGFGIWIVTQRCDSFLFSNGARDNFMIFLGLGRLSKEQKSMIFAGQEISSNETFRVGEGVLLADGKEIVTVKYPLILNSANWKQHILAILTGTN